MPNIAPVTMWINTPNTAGPAENQSLFPAIASMPERIIESGDPKGPRCGTAG